MMQTTPLSMLAGLLMLGVAPVAWAQLTTASQGPIVYGHHHLTVTSIEEHTKFWVDTLGGELVTVGKAGRNRWMGKRPQSRGVAMNPVDHPMGGGEGKSSGGRHPVSPWGQPEGRTRKRGKQSDRLIVRRRRRRGRR